MLLFYISLYLIVTLLIGWFSSKYVKNSKDFVLAGRKMPTLVVASGLFATWFGSETVMGASAEFIKHGLLGVIEDPFGAALCLLLIGLFYARPLYRLNLYTFSDYFGQRFGKNAEIISAIFMIPSYFSWIAAQFVALALILQAVAGIPFLVGVLICASVVLFYTFIGGMWSISITDTIQTVLIILGLGYIVFQFYLKIGGWTIVKMNIGNDFLRITPKEGNLKTWLAYFTAWITVGWGSIPQQDVFQRILSAKSEKAAVRGAILSSIMYLSVAFLPLGLVFFGKIISPDLLKNNAQLFVPHLVLKHSPIFAQILFFGALLSAIMSTCSAAILAPATVLAENLIKPIYKSNINDQQLLKIMRYSTVIIAIISVWVSLKNANIYELVGESSAISLVGLFVPLTAGLYWPKSNATGALLSMISGTVCWFLAMCFVSSISPILIGLGASVLGLVTGVFTPNKMIKQRWQPKNLLSKQPEN
jgi:solute:Na+ symporter, SSS family